MKKIGIVVVLAGILLIISSLYVISYVDYIKVKETNKILVERINNVDTNNTKEQDNNITLNDDLIKIQESTKDKVKEYNLWESLKEKLTLAISSQ